MERVFYTRPFKRLKVMEDKTLLSMMDAKLSMQRLWAGRLPTNDTQQQICGFKDIPRFDLIHGNGKLDFITDDRSLKPWQTELAFIIDWRVMDKERAVFSLQDVLKYFWVNILFSTLRFFFGRMDLFEKGQLDRNVCVAHQYKAIFPYCCHPLTL